MKTHDENWPTRLYRFTLVARPWHDATEAPFVLQSEAVHCRRPTSKFNSLAMIFNVSALL